jgi:annexin A7/11
MESALLQIVQGATGPAYEAELLEKAMAGMGTDDEMLVVRYVLSFFLPIVPSSTTPPTRNLLNYRIVRAHWDRTHLDAVKRAYLGRYGKTLERRVEGEIKGDYKKLMLTLVGKTVIM